jgi:hypothetical protein
MQQSHVKDRYYPFNHLDLFAGTGALAAEIYRHPMVNGMISSSATHLANRPGQPFFSIN